MFATVGLVVLFIVFVVAYLPSIRWVIAEWSGSSGVLSHGYLVAGISIFLIVKAIPELSTMPREPVWWLLPFVVGLSLVWLLAYVATVAAVQTLVLPAILLAAVAAAFGQMIARRLAFPILFVYMALPALEHLQFIFQIITIYADQWLIRMAGIPALFDGDKVHLSSGTFEIAGGCSGLSFVVAGVSLAVLYGHLFYTRFGQKFRLVTLTIAVAMIGNWIRVFVIVVIGHKTQMQSALVADHLTMGWIIFGVLMIPVFFLARHWEDIESQEHGVPARGPGPTSPSIDAKRSLFAVTLTALLMSTGPVWAMNAISDRVSNESATLQFPRGRDVWQGPAVSRWGWQPEFAQPDSERIAEYSDGENFVLAYANIYLTQAQDRELIYFNNSIAGDWVPRDSRHQASVANEAPGGLAFNQLVASSYLGDWVIWYRYEVGNTFVTSDSRAKLNQALETLQGRSHAGAIAFAALCKPNCSAATNTLSRFVTEVGHDIHIDVVSNAL